MTSSTVLSDPAAADHDLALIENRGLARSDGALRLIESDEDFVGAHTLHCGWRGLVPMANLHRHAHWLSQIVHRDQIHTPGAQRARIKVLISAHDNLLAGAADLDDVERGSCGYAQSLALAHCEVMHAAMLADDFAACGNEVAGGVG